MDEPQPSSVTGDPQAEFSPSGDDNPMLYCPVCCTHLDARKCKLLCSLCGYYLSCSDYY